MICHTMNDNCDEHIGCVRNVEPHGCTHVTHTIVYSYLSIVVRYQRPKATIEQVPFMEF
jgi:hypothetical protein